MRRVLAVVLLAFAAWAPQAPAAAETPVRVAEREFRITLGRTRAPAGWVRLNVANRGRRTHELALLGARNRVLARAPQVAAGAAASLRVRLRPGTYRLVCRLARHDRRGMRATLRVGSKR